MLLGDTIVSARDVGNIGAGYVAGVKGIPYLGMRLMFDLYQSATDYLINCQNHVINNPYGLEPSFIFNIEHSSTRKPQYAGWLAGKYVRNH